MSKTGTDDKLVKTTVPADHFISRSEGPPCLVVTVDLSKLGVGSRYDYDTVVNVEDGEITMTFYPPADDEGWHRLDEVGEW